MTDECIRAVTKALRMGADEAEACVLERRFLEHTIEKNKFKLVASYQSTGQAIRVVKNKHLGFSYSADFEEPEPTIRRALSVSKFGKELKDFSFPSLNTFQDLENVFDPGLACLPVEYGLDGCEEVLRGVEEVSESIKVTQARLKYGCEHLSLANSSGLEGEDKTTFLSLEVDTVLKEDGVSTGTEAYWSRIMDTDFYHVGKSSAQWALDTSNPKRIEGGEMTVLFHPMALREMLEFILAPALYADRARKGESVYSDRIGEVVAEETLSIYDDPTIPNGPNSGRMDDEGTKSSRTQLISHGELVGFLYDSVSADEFSAESTGNAIRAARLSNQRQFKSPPVISARNLIIHGEEKSWDDMVGEVKEGLLVHSVLGAHTSNPASGDFSVSSPRVMRIKRGEIVNSVSPLMLSGNLPSLLTMISGVGNDSRAMKGSIGPLGIIAPTVRFEGVQVTP